MNEWNRRRLSTLASMILLAVALPAVSRAQCNPTPPDCKGSELGLAVTSTGNVGINNCTTGDVRAFVRVAIAAIGDVDESAGEASYREQLIDPLAAGCTVVDMPFPGGLPSTRVVTAWVRLRNLYDGSATAGNTIDTKTVTLWTNTSTPEFSTVEAPLVAKRVRSELLTGAWAIPLVSLSDCSPMSATSLFEPHYATVRNLSPVSSYRLVISGKYKCTENGTLPSTSSTSHEDVYNRIELLPESCSNTGIKLSSEHSAGTFPGICDCDDDGGDGQCPDCGGQGESACIAHHTISCITAVVTEAKAEDGSFKRLPDAVWSDLPSLHPDDPMYELKNIDVNIHETVDRTFAQMTIGCEDFDTGPIVDYVAPFPACSQPGILDEDFDGIPDPCDPLVNSRGSVAGGSQAALQAVVRNRSYSGQGDWEATAPAGAFDPNPAQPYEVSVDEVGASNVVVGGETLGEWLFFDVPNQEERSDPPPAEGNLSVSVVAPEGPFSAADSFESVRMGYVATFGPEDSFVAALRSKNSGASVQDAGDLVTSLNDPSNPTMTTPRPTTGEIFGLDVGRSRSRIVISGYEGVEIFKATTGLRVGGVAAWPHPVQGRGVVAEDDLDGVIDQYAYVVAYEPELDVGEIRVVDLETATFLSPSGQPTLSIIEGEPIDIELRPLPGAELSAYVTSVVRDYGDCPAGAAAASGGASPMTAEPLEGPIVPDPGGGPGGGGPRHRRTVLTVFDMDRVNGFETVVQRQSFDLSCVMFPQPAYLNEVGLAWNEARSKLYVVVPDGDKVLGIGCCGTGGDVDDSSVWESIDLLAPPVARWPTDIVVGKFDFGDGFGNVPTAVVSTLGVPGSLLPDEQPSLVYFRTGTPSIQQLFELEVDSKPVSISARADAGLNGVAIVADRGRQMIRVFELLNEAPFFLEVVQLPTTTYPTRVTVQGRLGKGQPD